MNMIVCQRGQMTFTTEKSSTLLGIGSSSISNACDHVASVSDASVAIDQEINFVVYGTDILSVLLPND
jgi:hypothetical protein